MQHLEHDHQLRAAARAIYDTVYGPPHDTYRRIAAMRAIIDECPDEQIREILAMVAIKIARLIQTPKHLDSWIDIAGYSRCGVMLLSER